MPLGRFADKENRMKRNAWRGAVLVVAEGLSLQNSSSMGTSGAVRR